MKDPPFNLSPHGNYLRGFDFDLFVEPLDGNVFAQFTVKNDLVFLDSGVVL